MRLSPDAVRAIGSRYVFSQFGHKDDKGRLLRDFDFRSYFFLCPLHISSLFSEVCDTFTELGYYQNGITYHAKFLLWTLHHLNAYWTVKMSADWVGVSPKTFKTNVFKTIEALNAVYAENVSSWDSFFVILLSL